MLFVNCRYLTVMDIVMALEIMSKLRFSEAWIRHIYHVDVIYFAELGCTPVVL